MARKMSKKTRNVISGMMVGLASIFAVINFADVPATDVRDFLVATTLFFLVIVLLALLTVSIFKLLGWLTKRLQSTRGEQEEGSRQTTQFSRKVEGAEEEAEATKAGRDNE